MFNFQGSELIIILLLALVVLGPEKLPDAMRRLGRFYGDLKKMSSGFQEEFRSAVDEPMRELRDTANTLRDSVDFRKLADGERDEKPKSAEMAPADPEAVPTDDVPFGSPDTIPADTVPADAAPADRTAGAASPAAPGAVVAAASADVPPTSGALDDPADAPPTSEAPDEAPSEPAAVDDPADAPPTSGAPDEAPSEPAVVDDPADASGEPGSRAPERPAAPAPPPFSSSQAFSAAPRTTNGDGPNDDPSDAAADTPSTAEPPLAPQVAVDDEHGLREARPADTDPGRRDGAA